jgi:hypothetical protein
MSSINDYINALAKKAGVPADNAGLKELLTNAELAKINVPTELETLLDSGLHSIESAKNSKEVRDAMKAQILNGVDADVDAGISETELFDDSIRAELAAEKITGKRIRLYSAKVNAKIKELQAAKSQAAPGDKAEFTKTINDLKESLAAQTTAHNQAIEALKKGHAAERTSDMIKSQLSSYQYGLGVESDVALTTAQALIDKQLNSKQAKLINENGSLVILSSDGTKFFNEKNIEVSAKDFIEGAIAPILKKSDGTPPKTQAANNGSQQSRNNGNSDFIPNEAALEAIREQKQQFANS